VFRRAAAGTVGLAVALAAGIGIASVVASPSVAPSPVAPGADLTAAEQAVLGKLDADSRRLAIALEPEESVQATFVAGNEQRAELVADQARTLGLVPSTTDMDRPTVAVTGPRRTVLSLAAMTAVASVTLEEDRRSDRPVAAAIPPPVSVPQPGAPYAGSGLPLDQLDFRHLGAHKATIVAGLPDLVLSIDGQPYASHELEGGCDPTSCFASLIGHQAGSTAYGDRWTVRGSAATGWFGVPDPGDPPLLTGVPRWLVREAERVARADPGVVAALAGFDTIGDATWSPSAPGIIRLSYFAACGCCGFNGDIAGRVAMAEIAEADPGPGACAPTLIVTVDVGAGRVVGMGPA
jgi:hypothetical protein